MTEEERRRRLDEATRDLTPTGKNAVRLALEVGRVRLALATARGQLHHAIELLADEAGITLAEAEVRVLEGVGAELMGDKSAVTRRPLSGDE